MNLPEAVASVVTLRAEYTHVPASPLSSRSRRRRLCVAGCAREHAARDVSTGRDGARRCVDACQPAAATPAPDTATTLVAYQWQLESATDAAGQSIAAFFPSPDQPLGILFADGRLGVTGGCNRISAGYQLLDSAQLQVSPGLSTMMACPPPLANADAAIRQVPDRHAAGCDRGRSRCAAAAAGGDRRQHLDLQRHAHAGNPVRRPRHARVPRSVAKALRGAGPVDAALPDGARSSLRRERPRQRVAGRMARRCPRASRATRPSHGEQHVVRVKRFEQAGAAGGAPTEHFVLDLVIETRTVQ